MALRAKAASEGERKTTHEDLPAGLSMLADRDTEIAALKEENRAQAAELQALRAKNGHLEAETERLARACNAADALAALVYLVLCIFAAIIVCFCPPHRVLQMGLLFGFLAVGYPLACRSINVPQLLTDLLLRWGLLRRNPGLQ